jgi:hypothetical protein
VAKFAAGDVDTGGASWLGNISGNFRKKFKMDSPFGILWGWGGGGLIHEKNQKQKISRDCPFKANN